MSEPKLLPCPFCGGQATLENLKLDWGLDEDRWSAFCGVCRIPSPLGQHATEHDAVAAWNTRNGESIPTDCESCLARKHWINFIVK